MPSSRTFGTAERGKGREQPLRVGVERPLEQLLRLRQLRDLAGVHHEQPVGEVAHERHVVRHEDHREPQLPLQLLDLHHERALRDDVERRGRLVHDHELRREEQRHCDHRALPHPARELVRIAVQVHRIDRDEPQHLARASLDLGLRHVRVGAAGVAHLLGHGQHGVERVHRALHHDGEVAPAHGAELLLLEQDEVAPLEEDAAAHDLAGHRRAEQPRDRIQQRRLSAPRLADDREELAARELEIDMVDRDDRAGVGRVGDREVLDLEHRRVHARDRLRRLGWRQALRQPGAVELADAQGRAADLVEGVVEQREGGAEERDADAGRDRPERHARQERVVRLRPVEHRSPALAVRIAEPDELQTRGGEDGVDRRAEEGRDDERRHRRQDLVQDHVRLPLPAHAGRLEEVAPPQRQGLRAELPGAVRPAEHPEHDDEGEEACVLLVGGDHDDEREDRQDEDHVGDEGEEPVGGAAEIARRDAHEDGQDRGDRADGQRDQEREAGAPDELREDVLPVGSWCRASAAGTRASPGGKIFAVGLYGAICPGNEREHGEEEQQEHAGDRLLAAADGTPEVTQTTLPDLGDHRRLPGGRSGELVGRPDRGCAHLTSRVRGSRNAVATSAARIAVSTATTISRKRPCMSA